MLFQMNQLIVKVFFGLIMISVTPIQACSAWGGGGNGDDVSNLGNGSIPNPENTDTATNPTSSDAGPCEFGLIFDL